MIMFRTQATDYLKSKMVTTIIAADNGVKVSAEDITKEGNSMALYYGYDSYQKLVETYGQILNARQDTRFSTRKYQIS